MRLLSDAWRSGDRSPLGRSCSGILPRPTLSRSVIKRPQRSMSIGIGLECLTLDFGLQRERRFVGAVLSCRKVLWAIGRYFARSGEIDIENQLCKLCRAALTDRPANCYSGLVAPASARSTPSRMGSDSSRGRKDDSRPRLSGYCDRRTSQASRSWNARCRKMHHHTPPVAASCWRRAEPVAIRPAAVPRRVDRAPGESCNDAAAGACSWPLRAWA